MTGNRTKLKNFVEKFIGIVRFGNDHFGAIMGYGDYVIGDSVISIVDYMEGLGHNLFSVGKFCDYDLEIAFRKHSSFVRDMNGVDLLKNKKQEGSINGKKYIFSHRDDYSRLTWVKFFLRSKDETLEFVINFLKQIQVGLNKTVRYIRTDNGTEFVNQVMSKYYEGVGIFHQKSVPRTPQQNGVVERRNRTLLEIARTMLIFSKAPMFLFLKEVIGRIFHGGLGVLYAIKSQESEKSPEEITRIKREQEEKKQEPTYTINSTDKAALEEFDLKSALFKSMQKNKSANRNPANYRLYHALMEALIEDENAMDKEVADMVRDNKRKHDDDDDNDDEGPPAGSNQGKSTKRRRTRESESAKKPSTTKESSKDKDPKVGSKTGHVSDPGDTDNAHMPKILDTTTWFRPILEEERPASPEPECIIPPIDLPKADNNWANSFAKAHQDLDENKLHNKIDDIGSFIRWYCRRIGKEELSKADLEGPAFMMVKGFHENSISLQFQMEECHKLLTNQIDLVNPYGITHWWFSRKQFYINKHSEPSDRDAVRSHMRILSVISIKTYERYGYNYLREIVLRRADYNEYKISEKDFKSLHPNDFEDLNILYIQGKLDHLPKQDKVNLNNTFNKGMENRKWTEDDKRRSEDSIEVIERRLKIKRIFRSLESFVGGRLRDIDYRLISRTE
ncbi:integrase, catalytic region, zinc finger, CCHC-type containing protein [Tanacetum coccineum]